MLSMSFGLIEFNALVLAKAIPSTITKGSVPFVEVAPLIWKFQLSLPGAAELRVTTTPATCPLQADNGLDTGPYSGTSSNPL
jgi:hypothetical protein